MAGEASADLHASNLVKAMKGFDPDIMFRGIGGKKMEQAGVEILFSSADMAVVGLTEVLSRLHTITRASRELKSILKNDRPDLLILIDYPEFNLYIARFAKRYRVPVLYYISPQVWAWRSGRVKKIARRINRMAVILPFEEAFYKKRGVMVDYVGHPLFDARPAKVDNEQISARSAENQDYPVVGLLPGSRKEEITNLLPVMLRSAEIIGQHYGNIRCVLPLAPTIDPESVQSFIDSASMEVEVFQGDIYEVLSACDVAMVASGTATLETAIMEVPMVIVYKVSPVTYWFGKMFIKGPFIGLVNIVAGKEVVAELIQHEAEPERLAQEILTILEHPEIRSDMKKKLKAVEESLGRGGASEKTAKIALEMMNQ